MAVMLIGGKPEDLDLVTELLQVTVELANSAKTCQALYGPPSLADDSTRLAANQELGPIVERLAALAYQVGSSVAIGGGL